MFGSGSNPAPCGSKVDELKMMLDQDGEVLAGRNRRLVEAQISKREEENKKRVRRCGLEGVQPKVTDFAAESFEVLKPQDPKVMMRRAEAENYDSPYFRYSKKAAEGEQVAGRERLQAFPFHLENGGSIFNGDRAEHLDKGLSRLLSITELRESVLKDISFNDQKSLALTCKTAFVAAGHFYEVHDSTCADYLGNDCRMIQIGKMDDDQRPVVVVSSRVSLLAERIFGREGLAETQVLRTTSPQGLTRDRLVRDKMMPPSEPVLLYTEGSSEADHRVEARTGARHIMMTAVPLKATPETYNRSPRPTYQNSYLHMWRGFEAIYNVGDSIETLDISCQPMLVPSHIYLVLTATPKIKRLTLRRNHLLRISDTQKLMEIVHQLVPGCILDFSPYFFYGALHREVDSNFDISKGSFGLTWEDSGVKTEKVVAVFLMRMRATEAKLGMRVLDKGMCLRDFLNRLPLRPGTVDSIIKFWDDSEVGVTDGVISWDLLHRIVEPNAAISWEYQLLACRHCDIEMPQFLMHAGNSCAFCSLEFFANAETDRYRHEKEDIANSHLDLNDLVESNTTLGSLVCAKELPAVASTENAVVVKGFWDKSVGPWTAVDTSRSELSHLMEPVLRCRRLYKIRLRDLSWAYDKQVWKWGPSAEFAINCRKAGFRDRGPGDHEFFPVQHDNVFRNQWRVDVHTGESYQVAFLPDEFAYSSQRFYSRAGDWEQSRIDFTKTDKEVEEEKYRQMYSPW
ncbi:hypothetical protein MCOR02_005399 [Pyricularia oryzae]|nr:hypothetical protein MCOR02_005399 [Pyricularia oryzae]